MASSPSADTKTARAITATPSQAGARAATTNNSPRLADTRSAARPYQLPPRPFTQKMATGFKSFLTGAKNLALGTTTTAQDQRTAKIEELFPKVDPLIDGDECLQDCDSCTIKYPRKFEIDEEDHLYGQVKGWSTHVLVATGKSDWVRDVADEKGSVMQAIEQAGRPTNGKLMLSASNIPTPYHSTDYSEPTTVLLLPAFTIISNVTPTTVPSLIKEYINEAPTNDSSFTDVSSLTNRTLPAPIDLPQAAPKIPTLSSRACPHSALILVCSQKTRDARCGQSAPLLRKELERHLRPLGLYRGFDDDRPGGVGVYFISHVGGHKYSANMMIYRRAGAFDKSSGAVPGGAVGDTTAGVSKTPQGEIEENGKNDEKVVADYGAAQCIWLARIRPEDCENIVRFTVLQGKVVKPETQLRGGFDREKGLLSW